MTACAKGPWPRVPVFDYHDIANRLGFNPVGRPGEPYPDWVKQLRHRNGVYVIRDIESKQTLYVGESHSCRLYQTMTRHLQQWNRDRFGSWGGEHIWHVCFRRDEVEIAILRTPNSQRGAARAKVIQDTLILKLNPKFNLKLPEDNDVPF